MTEVSRTGKRKEEKEIEEGVGMGKERAALWLERSKEGRGAPL
jgi:hypothetical protein